MWFLRLIIKFARAYPKTFIVVFVFLAAGGLIGENLESRQINRLTAEAPAEVLEVSESLILTRYPSTYITYRYVVGGKTIAGKTTKDGRVSRLYPVGKTNKVCYKPANPQESEIYQLGHQCGH
jgi:hypothetical protein